MSEKANETSPYRFNYSGSDFRRKFIKNDNIIGWSKLFNKTNYWFA